MSATKKFLAKVKRPSLIVWGLLGILIVVGIWATYRQSASNDQAEGVPSAETTSAPQRQYAKDLIVLPAPAKSGRVSVEQALNQRRSRRTFQDKSLSLKQLGQMLWAAQGVTSSEFGGRTAPSAYEAYPLEIYLVVNNVTDLEPGIYHYLPGTSKPEHKLGAVKLGDFKTAAEAAVVQSPAKNAPAIIFVAGNFSKTATAMKTPTSDNSVYLEAGHAAQNLYLQAESLGLGMVVIGGYNVNLTKTLINLPKDETLIYAIPLGYATL